MNSSVKQTLLSAYKILRQKNIVSSHLDAELLLSFVLSSQSGQKKTREYVLAHQNNGLTARQTEKFSDLVKKRAKHMPLAYLTREKEFYGRSFYVDGRVLIPRPETEMIINEVKSDPPAGEAGKLEVRNNTVIIDVGTGSGCIIITLVKELEKQKHIKFFATDISRDALAVARKNAKIHGVVNDITFLHGNLLEPILINAQLIIPNSKFIILANLPYLNSDIKNLLKSSDSKALKYEPKLALTGGKDGLKLYRALATQVKQLNIRYPNIVVSVIAEIGETHGKEIKKIFSFAKSVEIKKDLSERDRLAIIAG